MKQLNRLREKIRNRFNKYLISKTAEMENMIVLLREQVEELKSSNKLLEHLSITDHLTGLNNMRHFYDLLEKEVERSKRYNHQLTVLLLDVNNFKRFNDIYGHLEGDNVLVCLGAVILKHLRAHDVSCRYGGDEFVIFLPETTKKKGQDVSTRIKEEFDNLCFCNRKRSEFDPTVSIGVVEYKSGQTTRDFLKDADLEMYNMKGSDKFNGIVDMCELKEEI